MNLTFTDTFGRLDSYNLSPTLPSGDITVNDEIIPDYAYRNNPNITSVTFGSSVKYIGNYAFSGVTNITRLDFSDATSLKYIGEAAFQSLTRVENDIDLTNTQIKCIGRSAFSSLSVECSPVAVNIGPCKVLIDNVFNSANVSTFTAPSLEVAGGYSLGFNSTPTYSMPNLRMLSGDCWNYNLDSTETVLDFRQICPKMQVFNGRLMVNNLTDQIVYMPKDLRMMNFAAWPCEGGDSAKIYYFGHPVILLENWGYDISSRMIYVPEAYLEEWQNDPFWGNYGSQMEGFNPDEI